MNDTTPRRRAPGMSPEERRAMIVAAALPLVAEYGAAVTTSQIARAAGIGEATIFRVFADKGEVLDACMVEAMSPDHLMRELSSISLDEPLPDRLVQAAEALGAHMERMGAVAGSLFASGHRREHRTPPEPGSREASNHMMGEAVTELIAPDADRLRMEAGKVASVFLSMMFSLSRPFGGGELRLTPQELVDSLLNGVLEGS